MKSIALNNSQITELTQILNELKYALNRAYDDDKLNEILIGILKNEGIEVLKDKKKLGKAIGDSAVKLKDKSIRFAKNKVSKFRSNGVRNELDDDYDRLVEALKKLPSFVSKKSADIKTNLKSFKNDFLMKSKDEKVELIASVLLGVIIFYGSSGGADLEGGIPDQDLLLGIGWHRHILSHSLFIGFIVEYIMRVGVSVIEKLYLYLPENHHVFWDHSRKFIVGNKNVAIGAMWLGIGAHLIQDSGITGVGMKPYVGVPFEMTMGQHQSLFIANGVASGLIGASQLKK